MQGIRVYIFSERCDEFIITHSALPPRPRHVWDVNCVAYWTLATIPGQVSEELSACQRPETREAKPMHNDNLFGKAQRNQDHCVPFRQLTFLAMDHILRRRLPLHVHLRLKAKPCTRHYSCKQQDRGHFESRTRAIPQPSRFRFQVAYDFLPVCNDLQKRRRSLEGT